MNKMKEITAIDIDKIVCDWTISESVQLTENQLNSLVDNICKYLEIITKEGLN